ncbi:hypothetical protein BCR41DRAFT_356085 [Lobosporangium transversale]|uniref:Uncharacterized protein n=1 Tax=Lobosporangium transversale TaxID=64571 RepID=A0A1Y2GJ33_9FUNG|nr:hypothetical protein BCR41DRAFT_356085 [Lobosporangium transversale]ORZ12449.1 hypothetical protein BCR41DRAFT_356085 [Lobosporangium transversale]|eukprot:XP_021880068.1 hypothetical protein BCR41DRAFT_356085 [Lobosporangium transversale]
MAAVSEFSSMVSRHVSQRFQSPIAPLTEANLYRHTITQIPQSRDAKLKHIVAYVEMQRGLIAGEEEVYRSVAEKGWRSSISDNNNNRSDLALELHSSQVSSPHVRQHPYRQFEPATQPHYQQQQQQERQVTQSKQDSFEEYQTRSPNYRPQQRTPPKSSVLYQHHLPSSRRQSNCIPDGLDPSMALPRALPRSMTHHDQTLYRDSIFSGMGHENDWQQLEELDPDSLAGIHLYGDTTDLQHLRRNPSSPISPSLPVNKYPTYEYMPVIQNTEWHQERHLSKVQQQRTFRQLQYPDNDSDDAEEDEFKAELIARHRYQQLTPAQQYQQQYQLLQQQRQLVSPPPTFVEKEKKSTRFSSRFSFLTRRQGHQRHDSMPVVGKQAKSSEPNRPGHTRFNSLNVRSGNRGTPIFDILEEQEALRGREYARTDTPASKPRSSIKGNSRMKQILKGVFGISKKKDMPSPESPFRDISLPSTHIRSALTPSPMQYNQHFQQQQMYADPIIHNQYHYSAAVIQRKGLVTPVSRSGTAQSNDNKDNDNSNSNSNNNKNSGGRNPRESLVDPIQPQQLGFRKMTLQDDKDDDDYFGQDPMFSPFGQTSLTPPPASSVLRHSTSTNRIFNNSYNNNTINYHGSNANSKIASAFVAPVPAAAVIDDDDDDDDIDGDFEPLLVSSSVTVTEQPLGNDVVGSRHRARRSSQLMPIPKDLVDSGCDSMGGNEPYATASNATTLNHNSNINNNNNQSQFYGSHQQSLSQSLLQLSSQSPSQWQSQMLQQQQQQQSLGSPAGYDCALSVSTYDNGPTIVSIAEVQKVDLEGLRQSHHHHLPPSHSHHLSMVTMEAPLV